VSRLFDHDFTVIAGDPVTHDKISAFNPMGQCRISSSRQDTVVEMLLIEGSDSLSILLAKSGWMLLG